MEIYLLKFSACLLVFWLVYVLLLERQKMHHFKRFYLIGALVLALIIPQLTITKFVEPSITNKETVQAFVPLEGFLVTEIPIEQSPAIDVEAVLWFTYGLGVLLFLTRFNINLVKLYRLTSKNENIVKNSFIYVLLKEYRVPHSFFKYIFLNKLKFKNNDIPKEVLLHEEAHAKQFHSLDIIIMELLQIVFWFHPLIYILKHHIKLNHEFLADQAVLEHGSDTSSYQKILLQFSSPDRYRDTHNQQLASAINYASIKKRFTIMKTQTSKTRIWLSTILLLPIIAILFYSFAEKEYVEKATLQPSHSINDHYARSIDLKVLNDNSYLVDGIKATKQTFINVFNQLHQDITPEVRNNIMNIHVTSPKEISNKETWFIYNALQEYGFYRIVTPSHEINRAKGNTPFAIESSLLTQEKATKKQIAEYNAWAKKMNTAIKKAEESKSKSHYPIIKEKDYKKYYNIYNNLMSETQRVSAEAWPNIPPPPPPPPPPLPSVHKGEVNESLVNTYNKWLKGLKNADGTYNKFTPEEIKYYLSIYENMTAEQKKNSAIAPPPPPPPPKPKKGN